MKPIILYAVIFLFAFILTSFGIIQLNSKFNNIFKFDFSPRSSVVNKKDNAAASDSTKKDTASEKPVELNNDNKQEPIATNTAKADSGKTANNDVNKSNETSVANSLDNKEDNKKETSSLGTTASDNSASKNLNTIPESPKTDKVDSSYVEWEKKTAKVYESMDPKKAAKILQNFSDNMARGIIYSMKKNKAADVLAELDPAFAARITRMP